MIRIHPLECGTITAPAEVFQEDLTGERTVPVMAFLISHPTRGYAVFDTGLRPDMDGRLLFGAYACSLPEDHDLASRLRAIDVDPAKIERLVASHAHFDHLGAADLLPNADLYIHASELERSLADHPKAHGRVALEMGHRRVLTGDSHDLFGDGSCELFHTPGHTCGHQSLRVKRAGGYDVLAGDACYFCETLEPLGVQPHPEDREVYLATLARLRAMARGGDFVVPGHDLGFMASIPGESALSPTFSPVSRPPNG
ncbi:MAG: N-acyl homoserine lactonase family protein [Caulobacter sp.]|nr:N-acyl homoserine lactonase family protein [Caulobacter sp.]